MKHSGLHCLHCLHGVLRALRSLSSYLRTCLRSSCDNLRRHTDRLQVLPRFAVPYASKNLALWYAESFGRCDSHSKVVSTTEKGVLGARSRCRFRAYLLDVDDVLSLESFLINVTRRCSSGDLCTSFGLRFCSGLCIGLRLGLCLLIGALLLEFLNGCLLVVRD